MKKQTLAILLLLIVVIIIAIVLMNHKPKTPTPPPAHPPVGARIASVMIVTEADQEVLKKGTLVCTVPKGQQYRLHFSGKLKINEGLCISPYLGVGQVVPKVEAPVGWPGSSTDSFTIVFVAHSFVDGSDAGEHIITASDINYEVGNSISNIKVIVNARPYNASKKTLLEAVYLAICPNDTPNVTVYQGPDL